MRLVGRLALAGCSHTSPLRGGRLAQPVGWGDFPVTGILTPPAALFERDSLPSRGGMGAVECLAPDDAKPVGWAKRSVRALVSGEIAPEVVETVVATGRLIP